MTILAFTQGLYYLVTGLWPVVDIDSFQAVTGAKTDLWLVKTVGLLIAAVGVALLMASRRKDFLPEIAVLAVGCALALGGVDLYYALTGVISKVYLLDAPIEAALVAAWAFAGFRAREMKKAGADRSAPASLDLP